jgi:hypothetical protein
MGMCGIISKLRVVKLRKALDVKLILLYKGASEHVPSQKPAVRKDLEMIHCGRLIRFLGRPQLLTRF